LKVSTEYDSIKTLPVQELEKLCLDNMLAKTHYGHGERAVFKANILTPSGQSIGQSKMETVKSKKM
jgi:hypothetical protein